MNQERVKLPSVASLLSGIPADLKRAPGGNGFSLISRNPFHQNFDNGDHGMSRRDESKVESEVQDQHIENTERCRTMNKIERPESPSQGSNNNSNSLSESRQMSCKRKSNETEEEPDEVTVKPDCKTEQESLPKVHRPSQKTQRVRSDSASSKSCHVCQKVSRNVRLYPCSNIRLGTCRKAVCQYCCERNNWKPNEDEVGKFICCHCHRVCPKRAQCHVYKRVNRARGRQKTAQTDAATSNMTAQTNSALFLSSLAFPSLHAGSKTILPKPDDLNAISVLPEPAAAAQSQQKVSKRKRKTEAPAIYPRVHLQNPSNPPQIIPVYTQNVPQSSLTLVNQNNVGLVTNIGYVPQFGIMHWPA